MQHTGPDLETISIETITRVTGGGFGGWGGMIQNALGGKNGGEGRGKGLGELMGGGGGGLNGRGGGLAESVSGWARGLFSGGRSGGVVEGK